MRRLLHVGELGLLLPPPAPAPADDEERDAPQHDERQDPRTAAAAAAARAAALSRRGDTVDEVDERGGRALRSVRVDRLRGQRARLPLGQHVAERAEVVADHAGVRPAAVEVVRDRVQRLRGISAGLVRRALGEHGDVHRSRPRRLDLVPDHS